MRPSTTSLPRHLSRRAFILSTRLSHPPPFKSSPAPPRLPKEDQEIFERLQRQSTGAFSTPRSDSSTPNTNTNASTSNTAPPTTSDFSCRPQVNQSPAASTTEIRFENGKQIKEGEDLHPNMRRGAPPEFEGDTNPKTGEVGGPKNEPLRWGGGGDWSYNGRVTDF